MILNETHSNDYLQAVRSGTLKQGLGIDCKLDENLRFKYGQFNVIVGHANVGKTDWIIWYMVCLSVKHSLNWLIYSSENTVGSLKRKIIEYKTSENLEDLSEEDYNKANQWVNFKFKFVDTSKLYTGYELLKVFEGIADQFDGAIIDPYNSLKKEPGHGNSHEYDYTFASEVRLFCERLNKTIYIIGHGVTEALRKTHRQDHPMHGHTMPLNAADIEGGGKWVNRCNDMIVLHRYTQSKDEWFITQVHTRKIKETETGGKPTFIDEPIKCIKYKNTFTVEQQNPLSLEENKLTYNNSIKIARERAEEDFLREQDEQDIPF